MSFLVIVLLNLKKNGKVKRVRGRGKMLMQIESRWNQKGYLLQRIEAINREND